MDPLTHALAGATIAWAAAGRTIGRKALVAGAVAAVLPDVDVLIRSTADPLLAIEHHRGFTHSLLFVLAGGMIAAIPFILKSRKDARSVSFAAILAYLTHPLLDASTTYGTQLFWPFSRYRVGLDIISILDPLFTLVLLTGVLAAVARRRRFVIATLCVVLLWFAAGGVQHSRAMSAQERLAQSRRDVRERGEVFPTVGNTVVWRSIYQSRGVLRMDRIRVPCFGAAEYARTDDVPVMTASDLTGSSARIQHDFERFAWFSSQWVARDPAEPGLIADARYSLRADRWVPIWGVRFDDAKTPPTSWVDRTRDRRDRPTGLWKELTGRNLDFRPIE